MSEFKYKYIHILFSGEIGWVFFKGMMELLNDESNGFRQNEQLFVTSCEPLFQLMKEQSYTNIYYFPNKKNNSVRLINYFVNKADWLFVHGMTSIIESFRINPLYRKRIIWRTWGHDTGYLYNDNRLKNVIKYILNLGYRHVVRSFYAVGIGNSSVDRINIQNKFGNVKILTISYASLTTNQSIVKVLAEPEEKEQCFIMMLGHSGHIHDHHIQILKKLERFKDENIMIYIPLSYGDGDYIESVKKQIDYDIWGDKVKVVDELMPYEDYIRFLKKINLAIIDVQGSAALGNIMLLQLLGKTMCVNREGLVHVVLNQNGISHFTTDELSSISFNKLCEPAQYTPEQRGHLLNPVNMWKELYSSLPN